MGVVLRCSGKLVDQVIRVARRHVLCAQDNKGACTVSDFSAMGTSWHALSNRAVCARQQGRVHSEWFFSDGHIMACVEQSCCVYVFAVCVGRGAYAVREAIQLRVK